MKKCGGKIMIKYTLYILILLQGINFYSQNSIAKKPLFSPEAIEELKKFGKSQQYYNTVTKLRNEFLNGYNKIQGEKLAEKEFEKYLLQTSSGMPKDLLERARKDPAFMKAVIEELTSLYDWEKEQRSKDTLREPDPFLAFKKASGNTLEPDDVAVIMIALSYKSVSKEVLGGNGLRGVPQDTDIIDKILPQVKDKLLISDQDPYYTALGGKDVLKNIIQKTIRGKKAVLAFYSGHGMRDGGLPLSTHSRFCRQYITHLYKKFKKSGWFQDEMYFPGPTKNLSTRKDEFCFVNKKKKKSCGGTQSCAPPSNNGGPLWVEGTNNRFCTKKFLTRQSAISVNGKTVTWANSGCDWSNYLIYPEFFHETFKVGGQLALVLDSCFSGKYRKAMKAPNYFLATSSSQTQTSSDGYSGAGGSLVRELRARLRPENLCEFDGLGVTGRPDGVLTLSEWMYDIDNMNWEKSGMNPQVMRAKFLTTDNELLLNLPIKVFSIEECRGEKNGHIEYFSYMATNDQPFAPATSYSDIKVDSTLSAIEQISARLDEQERLSKDATKRTENAKIKVSIATEKLGVRFDNIRVKTPKIKDKDLKKAMEKYVDEKLKKAGIKPPTN